jgi:hypothetical protein
MCYERATDTSCVAGNRMILLDRLGETAVGSGEARSV